MNVIIRLQGLPWSASAMDIRQYFQTLMIPEGGVHIVGGDLGDAFIAFGSDEDARQAMLRDSGKIKDSRVKLLLSSRSEMQTVIEMARSQSTSSTGQASGPSPQNQPAINSGIQENLGQQQNRWGEARGDGPRNRRDRNSRERSRERDRGGRERRRRSRSRSRSPRRSRDKDRDTKRKDDRDGRRSSERNRRDDGRKRDDNKMGEIKREPMGLMGAPRVGMMMPNSSGPQMGPQMGFGGPFGGPDRGNVNSAFAMQHGEERMGAGGEWRNRGGGVWNEPPDGLPLPYGMMRQGFGDNKDWDGPQQGGEPFGRGGARSRWNRDAANSGGDVMRSQEPPMRLGDGRRGGDGFVFDERRNNDGAFPGAREFPERRMRGDGAFTMGRGRFGNDGADIGGDRYAKGPPIPLGRQGFEPRGGGNSGGRDAFGMEPNFPPMAESFGGGAGERRGTRDQYPAEGGRNVGMDRRGAFEPMPAGRAGAIRRGSTEFSAEGPAPRRGAIMDSDTRGSMDFRGGVSNGRPIHDRFDDYQQPKRQSTGFCVEMSGMHYDVSRGDIYDFFRGLEIAHDGIKLFQGEGGLRTMSAVVRFTSEAFRNEALKRSGQYLGSKCVEIIACSDNFFDKSGNNNRYNRPNLDSEYTTCVMIRGLPFNFKEEEIIDLFEGIKVVSALMERDRSGDVTGNGFVEFDSAIDAKQAANSKKKIGHKYLELCLTGRDRMVAARNVSEGKKDSSDRPDRSTSSPNRLMSSDCCLIQGLPFTATDRDIVEFFAGVNVMPVTIHIMLNKSSQPSGDAFCEFKSVQECEQALRKNKQCIGSRTIQVKSVSRKEMLDALGLPPQRPASGSTRGDRPPPGRSSMDGRMMGESGRSVSERGPLLEPPYDWGMGGGHEGLPRGLQGFGKPGCVVGARNVPYRASIDEMLDFFRDYDLAKENIIRRYNEKGQPTGEARISFRTPTDAQKAVRELNLQSIGGRLCSLFLV